MAIDRQLRALIGAGLIVGLLGALAAFLFIADQALALWERLERAPDWIAGGIVLVAIAITGIGGWLVFRLLVPRRRVSGPSRIAVTDEASLHERLASAQARGVDVGAARSELRELAGRREAQQIYVSFLGHISTGKSSLIRALVPEAEPVVSVAGGSTRAVTHYRWSDPGGAELVMADVPGLGQAGGSLDEVARDEALRAHVVIYVSDGDLTRDDFQQLAALVELGKPMVLALNKADQYQAGELDQIRGRIAERIHAAEGDGQVELVSVSAGGAEEIVEIHPDGREERAARERRPKVDALALALRSRLAASAGSLDGRRDEAVFALAAHKLARAESSHQRREAEVIVRRYTRRAVLGALAAVSPGTDLLIQGYLGTRMVQELCAAFAVAPREIDVDAFMALAQQRVAKAGSLLLAVAGNALKAFPGVGTLAGGGAHAVCYGLIFDALGRSLSAALAEGGALKPDAAAARFEETLSENLESRAQRLVGLALASRQRPDD